MLLKWFGSLLAILAAAAAAAADLPLDRIRLPPGFHIELLARVPNAREMALGDGRVLFIGSMREGAVHALELDERYNAGKLHVVASDLAMPVGVAFHQGSLYVSAVDRILRFDDIVKRLDRPPTPVTVRDDFPSETHHGWKFIAFGPDGWLYVPVGAPCNACERDPDRYAVIMRMKADGSRLETFARGVRNTVGFDWHPETRALWFTDNGRDWLGDNEPPDELDHAPKSGMHFGFPHCHGSALADPNFGKRRGCGEFTAPARDLDAHVAALGMRFYTGRQFPAEYRNAIFIAEHGSWNRLRKVGYRVSVVRLDGDKVVSYMPFATGWLQDELAWGRPADVLVLPDGSLLVADDHAGAIYRIRYGK